MENGRGSHNGDAPFPVYPPELMKHQPSDKHETDDVRLSWRSFSTSAGSPSRLFDFLQLSESNDCLQLPSPFSPSPRRFFDGIETGQSTTVEAKDHRHETEVSVNMQNGRINSELVCDIEREIEAKEVMAVNLCQEDEETTECHTICINLPLDLEGPSSVQQSIDKAKTENQGNTRNGITTRKDSTPKIEELRDPETLALFRSPRLSHPFPIPNTSRLALRRKVKREASQPLSSSIVNETRRNTKESLTPRNRSLLRPTMSHFSATKSKRVSSVANACENGKLSCANRSPKTPAMNGWHCPYTNNTRIRRSAVRWNRTTSDMLKMGQKERASCLQRDKLANIAWENDEIFLERNRKKAVPTWPRISQPNSLTCPVSSQLTRKFHDTSNGFASCKASQFHPSVNSGVCFKKQNSFVIPEKLRGSPISTVEKTQKSSWMLNSQGMNDTLRGHKPRNSNFKSTDDRREATESLQCTQISTASLPKICRPRQQRLLRRKAISSAETSSMTSHALRPTSKSQSAKESPSSSLQMSRKNIPGMVPNATPFHLRNPSTGYLAIRRQLKRQNSSSLSTSTRKEM